ncbi:MAG TPA: DUF4037 domain-containing protein [Actinocrinis sp.]|uniref:DUF4037 domain-containing protein n=1 Tax=Actinocrinis sp. TaxID=1920516 RepID=UPI002DDD24F3|nr:DUF4037 domain-containing protein [Actinocrinis sp.]HEV2343482.1 DUF4037 domain-containing protein [Actinocrinis sp.]
MNYQTGAYQTSGAGGIPPGPPAPRAFVTGRDLSAAFYKDVVRPLLERMFPGLVHLAALVGTGSEVVGFDTERSTDHGWGPRLELFVRPHDRAMAADLVEMLDELLPETFLGHSVRYPRRDGHPPRHQVTIGDLGAFLVDLLGFDPRGGVTTGDWLGTPTQSLHEITGGVVFHDGLGECGPVLDLLAWYPDDLWRYVLACQWTRISQEEAFVGRCGEVGDELGSAVVAARLARELMRLCLLMARRYPPYSKWLGSAFSRLPAAAALTPELRAALAATDWPQRETHLCAAYEIVGALHNGAGLTEWIDPTVRPYYDRPFRVIRGERFAAALFRTIGDARIAELPPVGAVDQFADSTDLLSYPNRRAEYLIRR